MSLDILIKVDASQATAGIDKVKGGLTSLERTGAAASSELRSGLAAAGQQGAQSGQQLESAFGKASSGLSALGSALTGGAIGAGLLALGNQAESLINDYRQLEDEYTNLVNHEMKFVDATHTLTGVQTQQLALSQSLHSTMKESVEVYDAVGDALVDMNLSSKDLATITKVLGQEAVISGKSMSSAGEVLNRMVLAMDSGVGSGKALKQALVGYDAISDTLTAHFHTTRAGLIELVNQHKIGSKDIVEALKSEADQTQKNFDQRKITNEQQLAQIHEQANALRQEGVPALQAYAMAGNQAYAKSVDDLHRARDAQYDHQKALDEALPVIEQLTKDLENQSGAFASVGEVEHKALAGMVSDFSLATEAVGVLGSAISRAFGKDAWAGADDKTGLLAFLPKGTKAAMEYAATLGHVKEQISDLTAAYKAHAIPLDYYEEKLKSLNELLHGHHVALQQESADLLALKRDLDLSVGGQDMVKNAEKAARDLGEWSKSINEEMKKEAEEHAKALAELPKKYDEWEQHATDAISGIDNAWKTIRHDATDSAKHIEDALTGAFDAINQSILDMVTSGDLNLAKLGSSLEQILVKFALQQAEGQLIGAIGGGRTGFDYMTPGGGGRYAFPGFAKGGDMLVSGAGAPDSKLAMFRVSPGESIHVRTPEQRAAAQGGGGSSQTNNIFLYDPKRMDKQIGDGVMDTIRRNRTAINALLGR